MVLAAEISADELYNKLDRAYSKLSEFLQQCKRSQVINKFITDKFKAIFYANLILNFFANLNQKVIEENNLPRGRINDIRRKYKSFRTEAKKTTSQSLRYKRIDEIYYSRFKSSLIRHFPEFEIIISEIEQAADVDRAKKYFQKKEEVNKFGKPKEDFDAILMTTLLETNIKKKGTIPIGKDIVKLTRRYLNRSLHRYSQRLTRIITQNAPRTLNYNRQYRTAFEKRLYLKWKEPLDLLEILIGISMECGQAKMDKLTEKYGNIRSAKHQALIKIHARSILISNEILTLLKSGYVDGAYSRWRSLHELVVISYFLSKNSDDVSTRYLEHDIMRRFKEAKNYRVYYRELGEEPFGRKEFNVIKRKHDDLISKYGKEFEYRYGYEWIPTTILRDRKFRALEDDARLSKFRLFYNASSNTIHGGARGFYHMGLMNKGSKKILLVGPSNYGLADPIQYTSISLLQATVNLLHLDVDYESLIEMECMNKIVQQVKHKAVRIQRNKE